MNVVDAALLAFVALGDMVLLIHMRRTRARRIREEQMMRCLSLAVQRELTAQALAPAPKPWAFRRAS
jgi:hypothetical protein